MAGYSGTPLVKKLGLKPGMKALFLDEPDDYVHLLGGLPAGVAVASARARSLDFVHWFVTREAELRRGLPGLAKRLKPTGMIWVSWPKQASGVPSEVARHEVMEAAKASGLVDVKVAAVDETWSGLKLVIPVAKRGTL